MAESAVDAMVIKVRRDHVIRPTSSLIVCGIDDSESEATWDRMFGWLKERGLTGVDVIVSDAHCGMIKAISKRPLLPSTFHEKPLGHTPKHLKNQVSGELQSMFRSPNKEMARKRQAEISERFSKSKGMRFALQVLEAGFEDAIAVLDFPESLHQRLRTTNMIERLNEEVRRRERVIRVFPNEESAHRLLGSVLVEIHEKWVSAHKYINMDDYLTYKEALRHAKPVTRLRLIRKKDLLPAG